MAAYCPVIEVLPEWISDTEKRGGKAKFWYQQPDGNTPAWLFKFPRETTGEHWAEKVAAEVAGLLGIPCARVELAVFDGTHGAAAENIVPNNYDLIPGNEVLESKISPGDTRELNFHLADHTLENMWLALDRTFESAESSLEAKCQFAGYLVLDAVIGNTDRHSENWGILRSQDISRRVESLSPSYDHGSSLGCELSDVRREELLASDNVGNYVERGRGQIYRAISRRRRPSPLQLVRTATPEYRELFRQSLAKLDALDKSNLSQIVSSVPDNWMTPAARAFAIGLMFYSCDRLQEALNG